MAKFVIVHGMFKHPSHVSKSGEALDHPHAGAIDNGFLGPSADPAKPHVLEASEKEAEKLDPGCTKTPFAGFCLKPLALHEAEQKAAAAAKAEMTKAAAEQKAAAAAKAGGK